MKPSGSKLALLRHCQHYAAPDVSWDEDTTGDAARFGNAIHAMCEAYVRGQPLALVDALATHGVAADDAQRAVKVWAVALDYLSTRKRVAWRPEVALAWDWTTDEARELPSSGHRDYSAATPTEVCLTVDVATMDGDCAVVYDWKTGSTPLVSYEAQAFAGGLAWARTTGAEKARAVFVHFGEDGFDERVWEHDFFALEQGAMDLSERLDVAWRGAAEPRPGAHCAELYCPALRTCPATRALLASNPDTAPLAEVITASIQTPEDAGRAYLASRRAKQVLKYVDERVKEIVASSGTVPTSNGKALRMIHKSREYFSAERIPPETRDEVVAGLREVGALKLSSWDEISEAKVR